MQNCNRYADLITHTKKQIKVMSLQRHNILKQLPTVPPVKRAHMYDELEKISSSISRYAEKVKILQYDVTICELENLWDRNDSWENSKEYDV